MIKVMAKADAVFEAVGGGRGVEFGPLRQSLGIHKSTLSQILSSMVDLGWLERDEAGVFRVGPRILSLARPVLGRESLRHAAAEAVSWLAGRTGGTACAAMLLNGCRVRLAKKEGDGEIMVDEDRFPAGDGLLGTATGRLLLAFQPRAQWGRLSGGGAACSPPLAKDLERIRKTGLASKHSTDAHGVSFARGIFDRGGVLLAAIGIALPAHALNSGEKARILAELVEAAQMAERLLRAGRAVLPGEALAEPRDANRRRSAKPAMPRPGGNAHA